MKERTTPCTARSRKHREYEQYAVTVNENFGVLTKAGNPYQIQLSLRYGF